MCWISGFLSSLTLGISEKHQTDRNISCPYHETSSSRWKRHTGKKRCGCMNETDLGNPTPYRFDLKRTLGNVTMAERWCISSVLRPGSSPIKTYPCRPVPATRAGRLPITDIKERGLRERHPVSTSKPNNLLHQKPGSTKLLECGVQVGGFGGQLGLFLVDDVTSVPEQSCRLSDPDFLFGAKQPTCSHFCLMLPF